MTHQPALFPLWRFIVPAHDMPPQWDGMPVEWEDWEEDLPALMCGGRGGCVDVSVQTCERCGWMGRFSHARGIVRTRPGQVPSIGLGNLTAQHPVAVLWAWRCPNCGDTRVLDSLRKDAHEWILDASDYTDEGSWEALTS